MQMDPESPSLRPTAHTNCVFDGALLRWADQSSGTVRMKIWKGATRPPNFVVYNKWCSEEQVIPLNWYQTTCCTCGYYRKDFRNPEHFPSEVGLSSFNPPPYESLRTDQKAT